jgi:RNA polymerase sigma-70 factor (ECF subfamily)
MQQTGLNVDMLNKQTSHSAVKGASLPPELSRWLTSVGQEQDKAAFTQLFKFFAPKIKRFGLKQYGNDAQANDLVQDTMANVWKKAHLYDHSKGAATTWIYTVMRNASFDYLRKQKNKDELNLGDDIWPVERALADDTSNNQKFHDHLMSQQLERYLSGLPQTQQTVLRGVYFQQLSQQELSRQLGVPIGTIKSRLRLALEKIRSHIGEEEHD